MHGAYPRKGCVFAKVALRTLPCAWFRNRESENRQGKSTHKEVLLIARPVKPSDDKVRVNNQIRGQQIRVVDENGEQLGIMHPLDALRTAESRDLDLVEVAPKANPPVCRIMDYGKYKYEQKRRIRESRKNQHTISVKEIKFRPKIDDHDFETKMKRVREFLSEGNKVKITIMFRGREAAHPEFGRNIIQKVMDDTHDICTGEASASNLRLEGRNMSIVLQPVASNK